MNRNSLNFEDNFQLLFQESLDIADRSFELNGSNILNLSEMKSATVIRDLECF